MRARIHPAAGAPGAGSRRRHRPRTASRSPARGRRARGDPARCPGWRSTRRNACSARNSGWSWLPMSDIQHAASRSRRASPHLAAGTADRSRPAAPAAGSDRGPAARPARARPPAADPARGSRRGMRCMNQPSRRPLALNTTRRTPVARSTRRSATAANGRSSMRRRDRPGSRSSARRPAPAITPVRSRASSRPIV